MPLYNHALFCRGKQGPEPRKSCGNEERKGMSCLWIDEGDLPAILQHAERILTPAPHF